MASKSQILREQVVDGLKDELEVVHRTGSFDAPDLNNSSKASKVL